MPHISMSLLTAIYIHTALTRVGPTLQTLNSQTAREATSLFFYDHTSHVHTWVLARISKMPVQNSNSKISACPDLARELLQILIPTTFNSLLCQKGQFTYQPCQRRWFVRKVYCYYHPKVKNENSS